MRPWRDMPTPLWVALLAIATGILSGAAILIWNLLVASVIDDEACRIGPSAGRVAMEPGERAYLSLPLPRARDATASIVDVEPRGTLPDRQVTLSAARNIDLGAIADGIASRPPRRTAQIKRVRLRSLEQDRLRDRRTPPDRAPWSMVIGIEGVDRGIYHLSTLEVRYRAGGRESTCRHDLSVEIAVGERAPDAGRLAPVYVGAGYGHALHTHCGIVGTSFGGLVWTADPPFDDNRGGPPPLWNDPTEVGTMRLLEPAVALFETRDKLQARFRPRAPEDPPIEACG